MKSLRSNPPFPRGTTGVFAGFQRRVNLDNKRRTIANTFHVTPGCHVSINCAVNCHLSTSSLAIFFTMVVPTLTWKGDVCTLHGADIATLANRITIVPYVIYYPVWHLLENVDIEKRFF